MSYANFKPTIWSKVIQTVLHEKAIIADFCNREFEGDAKLGGKVKIIAATAPTVSDYDQVTGLGTPETQDGTDIMLEINQAKAFNFMVDDIDKAQMNGVKLLPILIDEAAKKMATIRDQFVCSLAADATHLSDSLALGTAAKVKSAIDAGLLALREQNVDITNDVRIELPWWMYQAFKNELTEIKTSNDTLISNGVLGCYDGAQVAATNAIYNDGTDHYAMIRTRKSIAFASAIDEVEAYRPEKFFSDAVKGLNVYGAKIVRPDEIYVIKAHKG